MFRGSRAFKPAFPTLRAIPTSWALAVFCDSAKIPWGCGSNSFGNELLGDVHGLAAEVAATLALGGFGELGQAYEKGGADDPGLGALQNVTAGDELGCGDSFTPATGVLLADGKSVPIASLKPGDKVLATNITTGKTSPEAVAAVEIKHDTDLYNLRVTTAHGAETIHTTSSHLFWDPYPHYGWIPANHLKPGERLKTADGTVAIVVGGSAPKVHDGWMWDLTVPGNNDHDFYVVVGATPVLVHNSDCGPTTFYHGSDVNSLVDILNNGLDASKAAASYTDGPGGFFMATKEGDAEFFAVRNGSGAVIKIRMSDSAISQLQDAGAEIREIPMGPKSPTFEGQEFHVPTSAFDLFNQLQGSGEISVSP